MQNYKKLLQQYLIDILQHVKSISHQALLFRINQYQQWSGWPVSFDAVLVVLTCTILLTFHLFHTEVVKNVWLVVDSISGL